MRHSPEFLASFLKLTKIPELQNWTGKAEVHTQLRFNGVPEIDSEETPTGGRFDLVIESGIAAPSAVVVETKVGSGFGQSQLESYRRQLNTGDAFQTIPSTARYLVTLTTLPFRSPVIDAGLTWPQVHRALGSGTRNTDSMGTEIFAQFVSFLKEKGLSMLELAKTDTAPLNQWAVVRRLEEQLHAIVERLRYTDEVKPIVGRRKAQSEGSEWYGVYGSDEFWAGFGISTKNAHPEFYMWVEITVPGDRRKWAEGFDADMARAFIQAKQYLSQHEPPNQAINFGNLIDGGSRFVFAEPVSGKLDGDGEAVFEWLYERSKAAIQLAKRAAIPVTT